MKERTGSRLRNRGDVSHLPGGNVSIAESICGQAQVGIGSVGSEGADGILTEGARGCIIGISFQIDSATSGR